jgi:5-methylcytosine-specific restriction endonuclease McrA
MMCDEYVGKHFLTLEHKTPIHAGGGTTRENVTATCFGCNKPIYHKF